MHHRIGTRGLVLPRRRRARIDADARYAHLVRALDVVKAIADHYSLVRGRAQGRQRVADRIRLGLAPLRRIHADHGFELAKPQLVHHIDALRFHARRRDRHAMPLCGKAIEQLGDSIEHGILIRP